MKPSERIEQLGADYFVRLGRTTWPTLDANVKGIILYLDELVPQLELRRSCVDWSALVALGDAIDANPNHSGGMPTIEDGRISLAQMVHELASSQSVELFADRNEISLTETRAALEQLARFLGRGATG